MRRVLAWAGLGLAVLLALPLLLVGLALVAANTGAGQREIEHLLPGLTGGMVRIERLAGRFPDALRIGRISVADTHGVYLTIDDAELDWSPARLLHREVLIDRVIAAGIAVARLPESSGGGDSSSGGESTVPVRVVLHQLTVGRLDLAAPVAGRAVALAVDAEGTLGSLSQADVRLAAHRLDGVGDYTLAARIDAATLSASLKANEPANGLIANLSALPDLGAVAVDATVAGPRDALTTHLRVSGGPLRVAADGSLDLVHQAADLTVTATAPAMSPAPGVSWQSIDVAAHVRGPFTRPEATGTVRMAGITAAGAAIATVDANLGGDAGQVRLTGRLGGLRLPGPHPDLLAAAPLTVEAVAQLDAPDRPVRFSLRHPLISATGTARTEGARQAEISLTLPDLAPLAEIGGADIRGHADLRLTGAQTGDTVALTAQGSVGITGGMDPVPALMGDAVTIDLAATLRGQDVSLSRLAVNGRAVAATASGALTEGRLKLDWTLALADLAALRPTLAGALEATGNASGSLDDLAITADLTGDVASAGYKSGRLTAHVQASGLPGAPSARLTAQGSLLNSPLSLAVAGDQRDGAFHLTIDQAAWKSAHAEGSATIKPPALLPIGKLRVEMTRLADLEPLLGQPIAGSAVATLDGDEQAVRIAATVQGAAVPGAASVARATMNVTVSDPLNKPMLDTTLALDGLTAGKLAGGSTRFTARGPLAAVVVTLSAAAPDLAGGAARLDAAGTLNADQQVLDLSSLQAAWKQQTVRLLAPVRITMADGVALDGLRLGFRQAELSVAGRAGKTLDLTASLRNLPVDAAAIVAPGLAADGMISADARLTGTSARPEGTVRLSATGMRLRSGPGRTVPMASLTASALLNGTSVRVDTRVAMGASHVTVTGDAPLGPAGVLGLRLDGAVDLAMLNPFLAVDGRRVRGQLSVEATVGGTIAAPQVKGRAALAKGDFDDSSLGANLDAITATVDADGDMLHVTQLTARAGAGILQASGSIGLTGAMPVDLRLTADNARPVSSDLLTAWLDADLSLRGELQGNLAFGGKLHVRHADIRVPEKMPRTVATLELRQPGAKPPPAAEPPARDVALDLVLDAPQQVFIRGRGLDVELGGAVHLRGSAAKPLPDGGLRLRRGTLSLVGQTLTFTEGTIDFTGAGLADPALKLVATSTGPTLVAKLTVTGSARNPKIVLSSVPEVPQDEILAQLLFNTTTSKLSPLQLAQIASALASLSGVTGGLDPLESVRGALGLDRLSVGTGATGKATVEAGRYLARGVYLGAKQNASGTGTQATVQIDLAKGLKLEATAGTGTSSATGSAGNADAASVGVTYQFEY